MPAPGAGGAIAEGLPVMWRMDDRDHGMMLLEHIDLDAQLLAVRSLLTRNRQADDEVTRQIRALDEQARQAGGDRAEHLVDAWVDEAHWSVFHSAASSMAAAGMLAPLAESMVVGIFAGLAEHYGDDLAGQQHLVRKPYGTKAFWDPHRLFVEGRAPTTSFTDGLAQLAAAIGLEPYLPQGYAAGLKALFTYRNKMFHNGFEWPPAERTAFAARIKEEGWPAVWFERATSGGEPWVFYMSDTLIDHCMDLIDGFLEGSGRFVRDIHARRPPWEPPADWPPTQP